MVAENLRGLIAAPNFYIASTVVEDSSTKSTCPAIAAGVIPYVLENFADEITLCDLAAQVGMSRYNFCRKFHRECGISPIRWLWSFRVLLAAELIDLEPDWSLTDVAFSCGFTSSAHFSRAFKQVFNSSPSARKKSARAAMKNSLLRVQVEAKAEEFTSDLRGKKDAFDGVFDEQAISAAYRVACLALRSKTVNQC